MSLTSSPARPAPAPPTHLAPPVCPCYNRAEQDWDGVFYQTRMYDNRARWYDPVGKRFISEDPLSFFGGDTNLYRYAANSPANATDPSGNVLVCASIALGLGFVATAAFLRQAYMYEQTGEIIGKAELTEEDIAQIESNLLWAERYGTAGRVTGTAAFIVAAAPLTGGTHSFLSTQLGRTGLGHLGRWTVASTIVGSAEKVGFDTLMYSSGMDPEAFSRYSANPVQTAGEFALSIGTAGLFNGNRLLAQGMSGFKPGSVGNIAYRGMLRTGAFGRYFPKGMRPINGSTNRLFVHLRPDQYDQVVSTGYLGRGYQGAGKVFLRPFDEGRIWATSYSRKQLTGIRGFFRSVSEGINPLSMGARTKTIELTGDAARAFARPRGFGLSYNLVGWLKGAAGTQRQFRGQLRYLGDDVISSLDNSVMYTNHQLRMYRLGELERLGMYSGGSAAIAWWLSND